MPDYPFRFEKAPKKKGICPQCGHTNEFRYYEDLTGQRLEDFGKCERTNSCGYHVWPTGKAIPKAEGDYTPPPEPKQIFPSGKVLSRLQTTLTNQDSPFHQYAAFIGISFEHLARWRVGTEVLFKKTYTVFVHETTGQPPIVNAKWFQYGADGKRIKPANETENDSFSLKQPNDSELKRYGLCIFGEHLLDPDKKRPVMLVESEKTAVIASWFYTDYDWAAVGSANGLTDSKIAALYGRRSYWLCDADGNEMKVNPKTGEPQIDPKTKEPKRTEGGRKNSSIRKLQAYKLRHGVLDPFTGRHDGYDIADAIRDALANKSALPELLDEHQRHLIQAQANDESNPETAEPDGQEDVPEKEDDDLAWENQVGLPISIWYDKEQRKHFKKYGFMEYQNAYWFGSKRESRGTEQADDTWVFKAVSNFVIQPLLLIESKSDPKRIYKITNCYKISKVVDLDPKQFSNLAGFSEVVMSKGNFIFHGNKTHFIRITMKLFEESKEAQEIKTLGYHPDGFYAFSNGIQNSQWVPLDEHGYGIVEHADKRYFLPAMSKIYVSDDQEYQTQKQFKFKPGTITFKEYAAKFCNVYALNGNGRIGLLYYMSCLFRDIVFQNFRFFPHLYLFGPPQSGKSSLAWSTMYLFGDPRPPFMLNTGTSVAFYKQFAEFRNAVVWFDEYQNSIDPGRVQSLKTAYDGAGHTKSENSRDNRNKSIPVHSGCIVSGQELPTADNALFTRGILLQFTKTDYSLDEKQLHSDFNHDVEQVGVSHLTAHVSQFREVFAERFLPAFNTEFTLIKKHFEKMGIDDRIAKNMAILLATFQCLKDKVEFPFNETELHRTTYAIIAAQNSLISSSKETSTFWKTIANLYGNRTIKNPEHFKIETKAHIPIFVGKNKPAIKLDLLDDEHPVGKRVLFLHYPMCYQSYAESCRRVGKNSMDDGSLKYYLTGAKGWLGRVDRYRFRGTPTSAFAFNYEYLMDSIDGFNLEDMYREGFEPEGADSSPVSIQKSKAVVPTLANEADDDTPF